jgi:hypothetical protein
MLSSFGFDVILFNGMVKCPADQTSVLGFELFKNKMFLGWR